MKRLDSRHNRRGAILSLELIVVLPILIGLLFAIIEFSMLWSASHLVKAASAAGCRVATLPGSNSVAIGEAVAAVLGKPALAAHCQVEVQGGWTCGEEVSVVVRVPMAAAAPDLLGFFGFSLRDRMLVAQTVMRKE